MGLSPCPSLNYAVAHRSVWFVLRPPRRPAEI